LNSTEALESALQLHRSGRLEEAREIYQQLLAASPDQPNTIHLLGLTYLRGSDWRDGAALIEQAIALKPRTPVFHYNLGVCWRDHGEFDAAKSCFLQAIQLKADYGEAWNAWVETQRYAEGGADLAHISAQLQGSLDDANRRFFSFAAAKVCDDIGDHVAAFSHYQQGNMLSEGLWKEEGFATTCEQIRSTFSEKMLAERADWGVAEVSPIFIVGMPRSGSSLAEQILASHPLVFGAGELNDIPSIVAEMGKRMKPTQPYPNFVPFLPAQVFAGFGATYLKRVAELAQDPGQRPVDKMPSNFLHLGIIRLLFPGARIIHSLRHPLDTCLSCYFQNFSKGQEFSADLEILGRYFKEYSRTMAHWRDVMPGQVFDLQYEATVTNPQQTVRELLDFCGLPWDESCLDFAGTDRRVSTASSWQVRQPLYTSSMGRWHNYEQQLTPLIELLADHRPCPPDPALRPHGVGGRGRRVRVCTRWGRSRPVPG
jgi:tetratricopeptide (TPR) repeat protein